MGEEKLCQLEGPRRAWQGCRTLLQFPHWGHPPREGGGDGDWNSGDGEREGEGAAVGLRMGQKVPVSPSLFLPTQTPELLPWMSLPVVQPAHTSQVESLPFANRTDYITPWIQRLLFWRPVST